jgi:hypothetical protein
MASQADRTFQPQRAGISTASAELPLSRMRAKVDDVCREREVLRKLRQNCKTRGADLARTR